MLASALGLGPTQQREIILGTETQSALPESEDLPLSFYQTSVTPFYILNLILIPQSIRIYTFDELPPLVKKLLSTAHRDHHKTPQLNTMQREHIVESPGPKDTSTSQFLCQWPRKHGGRVDRKMIRARITRSLVKSLFQKCLHEQDTSNDKKIMCYLDGCVNLERTEFYEESSPHNLKN